MEPRSLSEYIADRVRSGVSKATIKEELLSVGWTEEECEVGYREGLLALGMPVPVAGDRVALSRQSSIGDIILNFFSFILLGISASALGILFFSVISIVFPDPLDLANQYVRSSAMSGIHYSIAALVIGFPLYFLTLRFWFRRFREDEERMESKLSRWLTYLVLLVAAVTIVGDGITVVFTFLQGEISVRFFLQALTVLVIAGSIFGFYFFERKKIQYQQDIPRRFFLSFGWGVSGIIVCGILIGLFVGGSPSTQRKITLDQTRSQQLSELADCIETYAGQFGALPLSLDEVRQSNEYKYCMDSMHDPETAVPYAYRVVNPSRVVGAGRVGDFELCATFALPNTGQTVDPYNPMTVWNEHEAGYACHTVAAQLKTPLSPDINPANQ